jgi:hypothetical protein
MENLESDRIEEEMAFDAEQMLNIAVSDLNTRADRGRAEHLPYEYIATAI